MFGQMEENLAFAQRHTRAALVGTLGGQFAIRVRPRSKHRFSENAEQYVIHWVGPFWKRRTR